MIIHKSTAITMNAPRYAAIIWKVVSVICRHRYMMICRGITYSELRFLEVMSSFEILKCSATTSMMVWQSCARMQRCMTKRLMTRSFNISPRTLSQKIIKLFRVIHNLMIRVNVGSLMKATVFSGSFLFCFSNPHQSGSFPQFFPHRDIYFLQWLPCRQYFNYSEGSYTHENHMFKIKSLKCPDFPTILNFAFSHVIVAL